MSPTVNLMMKDARVLPTFRNALFSACYKNVCSIESYVLQAAAEKMQREGVTLDGIFQPDDHLTDRPEREDAVENMAARLLAREQFEETKKKVRYASAR